MLGESSLVSTSLANLLIGESFEVDFYHVLPPKLHKYIAFASASGCPDYGSAGG
jgi:hypothetical protein